MTQRLHLQIERRWRLARSATGAGALALVGSIAVAAWGLWGEGVALAWKAQLLVVLLSGGLGGAMGALVAPKSDRRRALSWIGAQAGLAYETALAPTTPPHQSEVAERLADAVRVQARLSIRDVAAPSNEAWWLPLFAFAGGVLVAANLIGAPIGPELTPPPASASEVAAAAPEPPEGSVPTPLEEPDPEALGESSAIASEVPPPPTERSTAPPSASGESGGAGGAASERDTLERFLDRLRERPAAEPATAEAAALGASEEADDPDGAHDAEAESETALSENDANGGQEATSGFGSPPEGSPQPSSGEDGEAAASDATNDEADATGRAGEGEAGERVAAGEDPEGADWDAGFEAGEGPSGAGDPQRQAPAGEATGEGGAAPGDDGAGAGMGDGLPDTATDASEIDDVGGAEVAVEGDPLPSILGPGPESVVGGVRLEGELADPSSFVDPNDPQWQRSVERALLEGDLPAPYQEVIRNYFR